MFDHALTLCVFVRVCVCVHMCGVCGETERAERERESRARDKSTRAGPRIT